MFKKILIANWKEHPKSGREAVKIFGAAMRAKTPKNIKTVVCPPFVYLEKCASTAVRRPNAKGRAALGAQDVFWKDEGPYTGEVGPAMLRALGVAYVIIGHSERRRWLGETDAMVNKKIGAALGAGLRVVLCVGEPAGVRKKGIAAAQKFVKDQLAKDLRGISSDKKIARRVVVAYEPIWAIGTGDSADPADVRAMAVFIKKQLSFLFKSPAASRRSFVLYGGSVNGKNIADYLQYEAVDGALVGGASLKADEWKKMVEAIKTLR